MKQVIDHPTYGQIVYEESFWTGKKAISVNGEMLIPQTKTSFLTKEGEKVTVKGNYLMGVKLTIGTDTVQAVPSIKWYEIVLTVLTVVFALTWGNSKELYKIVPMVGGALGGFLSALIAMCGLIFMKRSNKIWLKLVIWVVSFGVMFGVLYGIAAIALAAA